MDTDCLELCVDGRRAGRRVPLAFDDPEWSQLDRSIHEEPVGNVGPWRGVPLRAKDLLHFDPGADDVIRRVRRTVAVDGAQPASAAHEPEVWSFHVAEEQAKTDIVEFMAAASRGASRDLNFTLRLNERHVLVDRAPLPKELHLVSLRAPAGERPWSLRWLVERPPEEADEAPMVLDWHFGVRVCGQQVLHLLRSGGDGRGHVAENAVEFRVNGLSGQEQIDVFLNGFSVHCEEGLRLDSSQQRLLRYVLEPMTAVVRSLIVRVAWSCGEDFDKELGHDTVPRGVVVSRSPGVIVAGHDCLPTAEFFELRDRRRPRDFWALGEQKYSATSGRWTKEGDYIMWPYVSTRKAYDRRSASTMPAVVLASFAAGTDGAI